MWDRLLHLYSEHWEPWPITALLLFFFLVLPFVVGRTRK